MKRLEEIVEQLEEDISINDIHALIASWRKQRKVLLQLQELLPDALRDYGFRGPINDALKDEP